MNHSVKFVALFLVILFVSVNAMSLVSLPTNDVSRHLIFTSDGSETHYYVERYNTSLPGNVWLNYTGGSTSISIACNNIVSFTIDCKSLYDDNKDEVWDDPGSGDYWYKTFIPRQRKYTVHLTSDNLSSLTFHKIFLQPNRVLVDGVPTSWSYDGRDVDVSVSGSGYKKVEIFFNESPSRLIDADQQHGIPLVEGYNLLANPFSSDLDISLDDNSHIVRLLIKDDIGMFHAVEGGIVGPHEAFYVSSDSYTTLTITGEEETSIMGELRGGWNLVGLPMESTVGNIKEEGVEGVLYRNGEGMYHKAPDDLVMQPYYGYWIFTEEARTIIVKE